MGSAALEEFEKFVTAWKLGVEAHALIIYSEIKPGSARVPICGNCIGAQANGAADAAKGVRNYLERIHRVMNTIDACPFTTIAAVHGVTFGGGFELAWPVI